MSRSSDKLKPFDLGREGEKFAAEYLRLAGYKIQHTNWYYGKKELDIVAIKDGVLIVFEVKTRVTKYWEEPKDAVVMRKQKNIIEAADGYVQEFDLDMDVQFDIISLVHNGIGFELEHIKDAFYPTL